MPGPLLDAITTDLEVFSRYTRARVDAFGTVLATFEGAHGGATLLVWTPRELAAEVLRRLPSAYRGRIVLGLDASGGDLLPFEHALEGSGAEAVLLVREEPGLHHAGGGWKLARLDDEPARVPLDHAAPPIEEERTAPTGLRYRERRFYPGWSSPALDGSRPGSPAPQGHAAAARGLGVYAAGLLDLEEAWTPLFERLRALP
ncbi:hypothetical protein Ocepr_0297 [Oceanithermus profundus DSM 14977]|uniref:Uncharacterized protein n=1 Tax=Oceanithermus profundus (strain DSM 14977 / NBRC 100410 / VKM B-2274 / 506) TaxID=670487 RepID=E4U6L9_OCEP5|nr:hypothetical protein [Oceanithermus profundus]ADR35757.1 hypothetical protein Ocepr_0297 [Oceanithermus profundus DSM 14977]